MEIDSLYLKYYDRLFLANINELTLTPQNLVTIILGTNGCGKSSLLEELSPLPADITKNYRAGGMKIIKISHNNSNFILSSGHLGNNKHSFKKDNIELNEAGTRRVQITLVEEFFNYTQEIHDIMIGKKNFTNLSVNERKHLIMKMDEVDYTYALKVFNTLKTNLRDAQGALKLNSTKMFREGQEILESEKELEVKNEIGKLTKEVDDLLTQKGRIQSTKVGQCVREDINKVLVEINKRCDYLDRNNIENSNTLIFKLREDMTILNKDIEVINKNLKEAMALEDLNNTNIDKLKESLKEEEMVIHFLEKENDLNVDLSKLINKGYLYNDLISITQDLISLSTDMANLKNFKITVDDFNLLMIKDKKFENQLNEYAFKLEKKTLLVESLELKEKNSKITCVNCNHEWHKHFTNTDRDTLKNTRSMLIDFKERQRLTEISYKDFKVSFENHKEYLRLEKSFLGKVFLNKELTEVFLDILKGIEYYEQGKISRVINKLVINFNKWSSELPEAKEKLLSIKESIESYEVKEKLIRKFKHKTKEELSEELSNLIKIKNNLSYEINKLTSINEHKESLNLLNKELKELSKRNYKNKKNKMNEIIVEELNKLINSKRIRIMDLETMLRNSDIYKKTNEHLTSVVNDLKERIVALETVVDALSPNEGLIAKSIISFIGNMTDSANEIINSVWSYDMTIKPCTVDLEKMDLNYRFPVHVDNRKDIPDIKMTSSSMKEIINLSFKIVAMKYLNLTDFPLFLDEFGSTMDETHRTVAYKIIRSLIQGSFKQIFIISHFESVYAGFPNTDLVVMSDKNIRLNNGMKYNEIIKITDI